MDVNYMKYETLEEEYITMNELMKQSDKNKTDFTKPVPESVSLFVQNNNDLERQYNQPVYEKTVRPPPGFEHLSPHHPSQNQPKSLQKNFQQQQQQPPQSQQQPQQPAISTTISTTANSTATIPTTTSTTISTTTTIYNAKF